MLNNEEKGAIITYLESMDSIFGILDFNDEEAPWSNRMGVIMRGFSWFSPQDKIDDENKELEKRLEYFVGALSRNFVDLFIRSGVKLMLEERNQLNAEKSQDVYEFISKNKFILDKNFSSLNNRITKFVESFRNSVLDSGKYIESIKQEVDDKKYVQIREAEAMRDRDYYMIQTLSQTQWFDQEAYRSGQLKTHFIIYCSECGLAMHFYDSELNNNEEIASLVSSALNEYIDNSCVNPYSGELWDNAGHEILQNFEDAYYDQFDYFRGMPQSAFSYSIGLLYQHLSMVLSDGRRIHFDENDSGWTTIVEYLNKRFENWHHGKCPEVPWKSKQDDSVDDFP